MVLTEVLRGELFPTFLPFMGLYYLGCIRTVKTKLSTGSRLVGSELSSVPSLKHFLFSFFRLWVSCAFRPAGPLRSAPGALGINCHRPIGLAVRRGKPARTGL